MYSRHSYTIEKKYSSYCHIFKFFTSEFDIDIIGQQNGAYERLSSINVPGNDIVPVVKIPVNIPGNDTVYWDSEIDVSSPKSIIWQNGKMSIVHDMSIDEILLHNPKCILPCDATLIIDGYDCIKLPVENYYNIYSRLHKRNSMTILGQTRTNTILCVVDKLKLFSRGFAIQHALDMMKNLGCINACILSNSENNQFMYMNEMMTTDKYDKRLTPTLMVSTTNDTKNSLCISYGKIISKSGARLYLKSQYNKKTFIDLPYKSTVYINDVNLNGFYTVAYGDAVGYVHGTQIKVI